MCKQAVLNILFVLADQALVIQPEAPTLGYSVLEGMVVIASLALAYFSWVVRQSSQMLTPQSSASKVSTELLPKVTTYKSVWYGGSIGAHTHNFLTTKDDGSNYDSPYDWNLTDKPVLGLGTR